MIQNVVAESSLIDENLKNGLREILTSLKEDVTVKAVIDMTDEKGKELAGFLTVVASLSGHILLDMYERDEEGAEELDRKFLPVCGLYKDGKYSGIAFHGVPGGQEINSFVIAFYNLAGSGQRISHRTKRKIEKLDGVCKIRIYVSLSCHHCPKIVAVCQQIAVYNEGIEAEMFDANLFPELVEKYKIERVPMTILNENTVVTGVKTLEEMTDIIKQEMMNAKNV